MAFKGNLRDVPPADVLQVLMQNGKCGTLKILGPDSIKHIYCSPEGITLLEPEILKKRRIGDIVVSSRLVTREDVERVVSTMPEGQMVGEALVQSGIITQDTVNRLLRIQIEEELLSIFDVKSGEFEFDEEGVDGEAPPRKEGLPLFHLDGVVIEAARRMDEWRYISENINDFDMVFTRNPDLTMEEDPAARSILERVDGRSTVRNISDSLLESPFEVAKVMAKFVDRGFLRPLDKQELLLLAQTLLNEGEIEAGGVILKKLRPNLKKIILDSEDLSTLADLFFKVGDVLTSTSILLAKVREAKEANNLQEAIPYLQQAHRIAPEDTRILNELALTSAKLGDKEGRIQHLISLTQIHIRAERYDQALQVCAQILETSPGNTFVLDSIPEYLVQAGNKQGAVEFLEGLVEKLGKKADMKQVAAMYRHILKINPTRKDITEKLSQIRNIISGGRKKYIQLAGFMIILLGGVCSWYLNSGGEVEAKLDLVGRAARLFSLEKYQEAKQMLLANMGTITDEDMRSDAKNLLDRIERELKEASEFSTTVEKQNYYSMASKINQFLANGLYYDAVKKLGEMEEKFKGAKYTTATKDQTRDTLITIRNKLAKLRNSFADYVEPDQPEDVQAVYDQFKDYISQEEVDILKATVDLVRELSQREVFADVITSSLISQIEYAAKESEYFLLKIRDLETRLKIIADKASLSEILEKAEHAMEEGILEDALDLYETLVQKYPKDGPLYPDFLNERDKLIEFFGKINEVENLARSEIEENVQKGYDLAMDLPKRYLNDNKEPDSRYINRIKIPVLLKSEPDEAMVRYNEKVQGETPLLLFITYDQNLNIRLDYEGHDRLTHVINKEGGAIQSFILNRDTRLTYPLGKGNLVEGRPLLDNDRLVLPTSKGINYFFNINTGNLVRKQDSHSISGISSSVISAHNHVYYHTGEGKLYYMDLKTLTQKGFAELSAGTSTAPVATENGIISASNDGMVYFFTPELKNIWTFKGEGEIRVDPLAIGNLLFVAFSLGDVVCLNLRNGQEIWRFKVQSGQIEGMAQAQKKILIICSSDGWVKALDIGSREELWSHELDHYIARPPVVEEDKEDKVFVAANDHLVIFDTKTGEILSDAFVETEICSRMAVSDGYICFGTEDCNFHYRDIEKGKDHWVYYASDSITSIPLITKDLVIVVDRSGTLIAIIR